MPEMVLYGFDGSTYVRTVKMLLAEKHFTDFKQVPLNVLKGEPQQPEHLKRHPFGKVPVLEWDGMSILETSAITRFLNDKLPGKSLVPSTPEDRARMDEAIGLIDSYGYMSLVAGVAAYHLFPDFVGGQNDTALQTGIAKGGLVLDAIMKLRGDSPFIAGDLSLADLYLAPIMAYVEMTPDKEAMFAAPATESWWQLVTALDSFKQTAPG